MSRQSKRIVCSGCDFSDLETYAPTTLVYSLNDGSKVTSRPQTGWCHCCDGIRRIEETDTRYISNRIALSKSRKNTFDGELKEISDSFRKRFINRREIKDLKALIDRENGIQKSLEKLKAMTHLRKSGARCISCHSENTVTFILTANGDYEGFTHKCGGHLSLQEDEMAPRFNYAETTIMLDQEGYPTKTS